MAVRELAGLLAALCSKVPERQTNMRRRRGSRVVAAGRQAGWLRCWPLSE
jgi:hypothetical protein